MIPIEWKSMHPDRIYRIDDAQLGHPSNETRVDRRNTAEDLRQLGALCANRGRGLTNHAAKKRPIFVQSKIPMGQIVRLIPQHHRLDHAALPRLEAGWH